MSGKINLVSLPNEFALTQNHPNPFNPTTEFVYDISTESNVRIVVYNAIGKEVGVLLSGMKSPGRYSLKWNAANLPSGVYFATMRAGIFSAVKKMLLLR